MKVKFDVNQLDSAMRAAQDFNHLRQCRPQSSF